MPYGTAARVVLPPFEVMEIVPVSGAGLPGGPVTVTLID